MNNYFGIYPLKLNPLPPVIKYRLSKALFLNLKVSAEEAITISRTYRDIKPTEMLIRRLEYHINSSYGEEYLKDVAFASPEWILKAGFITYQEIITVCAKEKKYSHKNFFYALMLEFFIMEDKLEADFFLDFLRFYSEYLEESSINYYLDKYLLRISQPKKVLSKKA